MKLSLINRIRPIIIILVLFAPFFSDAKVFSVSPPGNIVLTRSILDVANKTSMRGSLLYGLIGQETTYGSYLGKTENGWKSFCASRDTQDCENWRKFDCKDVYANARHFDDILSALGYARKDVQVSSTCAMGYAQFEPATWWKVMNGRGESLRDPWLLNDALFAAARHLKDLGADPGEILGSGEVIGAKDRIALRKYYCGADYFRRECAVYAAGVEAKAKRAPAAIIGQDLSDQLLELERKQNEILKNLNRPQNPTTPRRKFELPSEPTNSPLPQATDGKPEIVQKKTPPLLEDRARITDIEYKEDDLYLIGCNGVSSGPWRIEKRSLAAGNLDQGFGNGGVVSPHALCESFEYTVQMAVDKTHMYIAGHSGTPFIEKDKSHQFEWRIEKRTLATGDLNLRFGNGGIIIGTEPYRTSIPCDDAACQGPFRGGGTNFMYPRDIVEKNGYIYIIGVNGDHYWRIEKRNALDGSLVQNFGTSGVITSKRRVAQVGSPSPMVTAIADSTYLYIFGEDNGEFNLEELRRDIRTSVMYRQVIEKRFLSDGALDSTFGDEGKAVLKKEFAPYAVTFDKDYLYAAGGGGGAQWFIEKISKQNGSRDMNFGDGGVVSRFPELGIVGDITTDDDFFYFVKDSSEIQKRFKSNGELYPGFGKNGISQTKYGYPGIVFIAGLYLYVGPGWDSWRVEKRRISDGELYQNFLIGY